MLPCSGNPASFQNSISEGEEGAKIGRVPTTFIIERNRLCCLVASVMSDSLGPHGLQPTRVLRPWDFPGRSTGVGCHFLLHGIFLTQGWNLGLPHCRQTLEGRCFCHRSHQGNHPDPPGKLMQNPRNVIL